MDRLKIKKKYIGKEYWISHIQTIVLTKYMSDSDYKFAIEKYPHAFVKQRKKSDDKTD